MSDGEFETLLELRPLDREVAQVVGPLSFKGRLLRGLSYLRRYPLAALIVGVPLLLTTVYESLIASNIYVSEAHFIVRSKSLSNSGNLLSDTSTLSPLSSMSQSTDYGQAVDDYLQSRDVAEVLIREDGLLQIMSRPEADFFARFPRFWSAATIESLYWWRFTDFVYPYFDATTGITTLHAYAFRPEDAQRIARAALAHGEALINRLNERQQKDSIAFAQDILEKTKTKVQAAEQDIVDFRNREAHFDPIREGAAIIELISSLNVFVAQLKAELSEVNRELTWEPEGSVHQGTDFGI